MLAIVMGVCQTCPLINKYLPSGSIKVSDNFRGNTLDRKIETPLVFAKGFVACSIVGNSVEWNLGILSDRK